MCVSDASRLGTSPSEIKQNQNDEQATYTGAAELAKGIFQKVVDLLILIWYTLKYALNCLMCVDLSNTTAVFNKRVLCRTNNFAKFSDLPKYIALKRAPRIFDAKALDVSSQQGFTPSRTTLAPDPFNGGHCFGNVTHFLKKWSDTHDIESLITEFNGGTPLQGSIYQETYEALFEAIYYPELSKWIDQLISGYPLISFPHERKKWSESDFHSALAILDAVEAYLKEGHHPREGQFTEYVKNYIQSHHNKRLGGKLLASVRRVAELYQGEFEENDRMIAAFAGADLNVERFYHMHSNPKEILSTLSTLDEGMYELSLPYYSSTGSLEGYHSLGLIIDSGLCYILDSNEAIGWTPYEELPQTVGRLFTRYTGFDFSEDWHGKAPSAWNKVGNFFLLGQTHPLACLLNLAY